MASMKKTTPLLLLSLLLFTACNKDPGTVSGPDTGTDDNTTDPLNPNIPDVDPLPSISDYLPVGVGGGGAMSGVAMSPYNNLWFVGTDMGTLFRSVDLGKSWQAVNHLQAVFNSDLARAVSPGFAADGMTVFHASQGLNPKRSSDSGITFKSMSMGLGSGEWIRYWHSDSSNANLVFAGTNKGLLRSENKGTSWTRASGVSEEALGSFLDSATAKYYVGTASGVYVSSDAGKTFSKHFTPSGIKIRQFTGGRDSKGMTLAFMDNDGANACAWANTWSTSEGAANVAATKAACGYVWTTNAAGTFTRTSQAAGDHIKMAENDSETIYTTGARAWVRQYGTKVHVSHDKGASWTLKLNQLDYDTNPYKPWPSNLLEWSAVAMDVGWWDNGYESFEINRRNSDMVGGSGYFFMHASQNGGDTWQAPFTQYVDSGTPAAKKKWKTRGLEVISVYRTKFHPSNPAIVYAANADIGGLVSEDYGSSWRVTKAQYNSNYDYAFDTKNQNVVYAASGNLHDWPNDWHANWVTNNGGIYYSADKGRAWKRLTPDNTTYNRQFLSVGYDSNRGYIYGGTQEIGIVMSPDKGVTWKQMNAGFPAGYKIIPQIEVDPRNGNVYALLTGDAPNYSNQASTGIYFLDVVNGSSTWQLLRGTVNYPKDADAGYKLWYYPTAFAVDFNAPVGSENLWLVDYENKNQWLATGVWKSSDRGHTWDRVKQMTHPTDIKIDPRDSDRIYTSAYYQLDGSWGNGGQYYSKDDGATWVKNNTPALQQNARSVVIDPRDSSQLIYTYFGGGMLRGMNPSYQ